MSESTLRLIQAIAALCTAASAIFAVIVYIRQQHIRRTENLLAIFQRFTDDKENVYQPIFTACDTRNFDAIAAINAANKYKYLSLLEEIALLARSSNVLQQDAKHLFKFHFIYLYVDEEVAAAFWKNLGTSPNEKNKAGWAYQRDFAFLCQKD